jgi:hypothetical protein
VSLLADNFYVLAAGATRRDQQEEVYLSDDDDDDGDGGVSTAKTVDAANDRLVLSKF